MKMRTKWVAALVYALSVIVISTVIFVLIEETDYFWITYCFTLLAATTLFAVIFNYLSDRKRTFREFPANAPYAYIAIQYLIAELILAVIFCIIGSLTGLKNRYFISAQVILALVFGIRMVVALGTKKEVIGIENSAGSKVQAWKQISADMQAVVSKAVSLDSGVRLEVMSILNKIKEEIKYSDPMTHEAVSTQERQIVQGIHTVDSTVQSLIKSKTNDTQPLRAICDDLMTLIKDRNTRLKTIK